MGRIDFETDQGPSIRPREDEAAEFQDFYLNGPRGDGLVRPNNLKTGYAQGRGSLLRKAHCRICGYAGLHLERDAHDGGSLDGDGAGGAITTGSDTVTLASGATYTENTGNQAHRVGVGCPFCFSRNGSKEVQLTGNERPMDDVARIGF